MNDVLEQRIRQALERRAGTVTVTPRTWDELAALKAPRSLPRRPRFALLAGVIAAGVVLLALAVVATGRSSTESRLLGKTKGVKFELAPGTLTWMEAGSPYRLVRAEKGSTGVPVSCRDFDLSRGTCASVVGSTARVYRIPGSPDEFMVQTETGPALSNIWQFLQLYGTPIVVRGHEGRLSGAERGSPYIGWEERPGLRVVIIARPETVRDKAGAERAFRRSEAALPRVAEALRAVSPTRADLPLVLDEDEIQLPRGAVGATWSGLIAGRRGGSECVRFFYSDRCQSGNVVAATRMINGSLVGGSLPPAARRVRIDLLETAPVEAGVLRTAGFEHRFAYVRLGGEIPTRLTALDGKGKILLQKRFNLFAGVKGKAKVAELGRGRNGSAGWMLSAENRRTCISLSDAYETSPNRCTPAPQSNSLGAVWTMDRSRLVYGDAGNGVARVLVGGSPATIIRGDDRFYWVAADAPGPIVALDANGTQVGRLDR